MARRQSAMQRVTEGRGKSKEGVSLGGSYFFVYPRKNEGRRGAREGGGGKGRKEDGPSSYKAQFH